MKKYAVRESLSEKTRKDLEIYPEFVQNLLFNRGLTDRDLAEAFLKPHYEAHTHDPFLMKDMDKAVDRLLLAVEQNEKIIIYSDYDADGAPGGVVLHDFFKKIGFTNFENYIPHRHDEGFGLHEEAVLEFAKNGAKLLITIDCGIADADATALAMQKGIDVIITDHHLVGEKIPQAFAILNPKQDGCLYPEKMLCGSGVIFKLIQAVLKKNNFGLKAGAEKWFLDMVGIATLSDMVPLTGENRIFAYYGLMVLRKSPRIGLMKLLRSLKTDQRYLTEDDVGFGIAPRINAASRMGVSMDAFRLFATTDETEAGVLVEHLNKINDERKGLVASMVKEAKKIISTRYSDLEEKKIIVMGNPNWRPSLLGLVANSLMNDHLCPVFLWGRDGEEVLKGSCRAPSGVSLLSLMQAVTPGIFSAFGGHTMSGGFAVEKDKVHVLEAELMKAHEKVRQESTGLGEEIFIDKKIRIDDVTWDLYKTIEQFAPFGTGNPKPLFLFENVAPSEVKHFGKEKNHLELTFQRERGTPIKAIGFFMQDDSFPEKILAGKKINLVAVLEKSLFRNFPELRLRIIDVV